MEQQTQYRTQIKGQQYQVTEVHYWITPQKSGALVLPALTFTGEINTRNNRGFSPFGGISGQRVTDTVNEKTLNVRPKPASYPANAPWLPAQSVTLTETWQPDATDSPVGEALTRTLRININGQWPEIIPEITVSSDNDIKIYADQPQVENQKTTQKIAGHKTLTYAVIPTVAAKVTIPSHTLYWWNTQTDRLEKAQTKAKTINAIGGVDSSPSTPYSTPQNTLNSETNNTQPGAPSSTAGPTTSVWQWLTILFGLLWLCTLILMGMLWFRWKPVSEQKPRKPESPPNTNQALKALKQACDRQDMKQIEESLLHWANAFWPNHPINAIGQLRLKMQNSKALEAINALENQRYNPKQGYLKWDAKALYQSIAEINKQPNTARMSQGELDQLIPPLHPTS